MKPKHVQLLRNDDPTKIYDDDSNTTTWAWSIPADGVNLTWVNLTALDLSIGAKSETHKFCRIVQP